MEYAKWVKRDNGRWEQMPDLTPEEAHIELMRMIHVEEQARAAPCDNCGGNPVEYNEVSGSYDIYCTECIDGMDSGLIDIQF